MKFFQRQPKPPLAQAADLVARAMAIVHRYHRDRSWRPSAGELKELEAFADSLFARYATVQYIVREMRKRGTHSEPIVEQRAIGTSGVSEKRLES